MTFVGCDLHTRKQQVAALDPETGELQEHLLSHDGDTVERFYTRLRPPVTVGIESTGYALWFHALMQRLGHTLLVGHAAQIRAQVVRKIKTDRRDARHLLTLLTSDRFPSVWIPDPQTRDLRALVKHRVRLVRIRTMLKNGLHAIALNERLTLGRSLFTQRGMTHLQALVLPPHMTQRRDDSLELLAWLTARILQLDEHIDRAAQANPHVLRLMTHPGIGALSALTTVVVLGPVARFPSSKHVVGYIGFAPAVHASADTCRLGHVTKQGSTLLRFVLGQAAQIAARGDADLGRLYRTLVYRRGRSTAKVAIARKLLVRLYIMVRDQIDYAEFCRRGRAARPRPSREAASM